MAAQHRAGAFAHRQLVALLLLLLALVLPAAAAGAAPDAWSQSRRLGAGARGLRQLGLDEDEEEQEPPPKKRSRSGVVDPAFQEQLVEETEHFRPVKPEAEGVKKQVYTGPNIEEATFVHYEHNPEQFKDADRVYLPVYWVGLVRDGPDGWRAALQKFIRTLDTRKKYWTVVHTPSGLAFPRLAIELPPELDIVVFSSGGLTPGAKNVIIPLLKAPVEEQNPPDAKDIRVSFIGSPTASPTRKELHELYGRDWFWYKGGSSWKEHLGRSDFSICPVGFGQASFRLAEAIALETIPVYVWESVKMLPYTELFNWKDVAIVVHSSKVARLGAALEKANEKEMRNAVRRVKALFTYEAVVHYIAGFVNEDRDGPFWDADGTALGLDGTPSAGAAAGSNKAVAAGSGGGKAAGAAAKAAPSASQAVAEMEDAEVANADRLAVNRNGAGGKAGKAASGGGAAAGEPDDRNEESPTAGKKRAGAGAAGGVTAAKDQASSKGTGTAALNPKAATTADEKEEEEEDAAAPRAGGAKSGKAGSAAGGDGSVADENPASRSATPGAAGKKGAKEGSLPANQASAHGTPVVDEDAHTEKVRAKQRVSGAASLVQSEGGLDRSTALENAKTIMEPHGEATAAGRADAAAGLKQTSAEASKANSKRVAEVTAALASNGAKSESSSGEKAPRRKSDPSAAVGAKAARGGASHKDSSSKALFGSSGATGAAVGGAAASKPQPVPAAGAEVKRMGQSEMVWDSKAGKRVPKPQAGAAAGNSAGASGKGETVWDAKAGKRMPKHPDAVQK